MNVSRIITIILVALFIIAVARLARLENGGPPHAFVMLPGQEPATMYLPGPGFPFYTQFPKPVAERPPAVVLIHGFSGDRRIMSTLARRLAENGYGVLAIDVNGHGENRNPFNGGEAESDALRDDVKKAVDYLRGSELVDGSRIVVIGHSMGAGAALDYATHDPNLKGAVMISGGWVLGPERPNDALFIFAANDPDEPIQQPSIALATHLAVVPKIELGKSYGDFAQGGAVEAVRVPGVNHLTIITSPEAATTIVKWLDSAFGTARTGAIELKDPRRGAARFALLMFVFLLVPLGRICGSMAPSWAEQRPGPSAWIGLLVVGGALLTSMPFAAEDPASFVPLGYRQYPNLMVRSRRAYRGRGYRAVAFAGVVPNPRRRGRCDSCGRGGIRSRVRMPGRDVTAVAPTVVVARAAADDGDGRRADVSVLDRLRVAGAARRTGCLDDVGVDRPHPNPDLDGGGRDAERLAVCSDVDLADHIGRIRDDRNFLGVGVQHIAQPGSDRDV